MAGTGALDLSIKISGKIDKSLQNAIRNATQQVSGFSKGISSVGKAGLAAMGTMAAGTVMAIANCTKEAQIFEGQMADVAKYVDGLTDSSGYISELKAPETMGVPGLDGNTYAQNYEVMKDAILDLSTQIPYTAEELTRLAAAAGQSNKSISDLISIDGNGRITGFLRDVAVMGTAMDISADQAGDWAAKWETAFTKVDKESGATRGFSHEEVITLAEQINYLGNTSATTAAEIAQVVNDSASLGQIGGMEPASVAAMGDAMLTMGVDVARTSTSIKNMISRVSMGESATNRQKEAWRELGLTASGVAKSMQIDATGTWIDIFQRIKSIDASRQVAVLKDLFGQWSIEGAAKLTGNIDTFIEALEKVNDPNLYTGSLERELVVKTTTKEGIDLMTGNAMKALKIDIGDAFLPVSKQIGLMKLDFIDKIRDNLPDLARIAEKLMPLIEKSVNGIGNAIIHFLPYIEQAIDYVSENGEETIKILGMVTAGLTAMKFAPQIEGGIMTGKELLFGSGEANGRKTGSKGGKKGFFPALIHGGRSTAEQIGNTAKAASIGAAIAANTETETGKPGLLGRIQDFTIGSVVGIKNRKGLTGPDTGRKGRNSFSKSIVTATEQIQYAKNNGGLAGMAKSAVANSRIGQYVGGIRDAGRNIANTNVGSGILRTGRAVGGTAKEIVSGIFSTRGILPYAEDIEMAKGVFGLMGESVRTKAGNALNLAANSKAGKAIGGIAGRASPVLSSIAGKGTTMAAKTAGFAGKAAGTAGRAAGGIGAFAGAGANLLGKTWEPAAGGFMNLFVGAAPVIAGISGIIAVLGILYDNMDGIRDIIGKVFGEQGLAVFDVFKGKLDSVISFITGLFADGGVAAALEPMQMAITNMFGENAGAAFGGLIQVIQSVMSVIGQVVNFSNSTVRPIIEGIFTYLTGTVIPVILQTFTAAAPTISSIISNIGSAMMTGMQIIASATQAVLPIIVSLINIIAKIGSYAIPIALSAFEILSSGINSIVSSIQGILQGLNTFITGVFTGNWSQAWEGAKQIFGNAFDALVTLCKTPINAVIAVINGAIGGINKILGSIDTIPDWVPGIGGKKFNLQIPTMPQLAKGGFTTGVSIAGEAGTEAVISFQRSVRENNISTWIRAGQMLGVDGDQAARAAGMTEVRESAPIRPILIDPPIPNRDWGYMRREKSRPELKQFPNQDKNESFGGSSSGIVFAPKIIINGNADRDILEQALAEAQSRFERWYDQMMKKKMRVAY